MKRLRFCMVPIAATLFVLLAMSFAWAKVVDFRANVTPTVVKTGEKAYLVVELLNDQGQVDPFGYQEVSGLEVEVASLLGDIPNNYNSTVSADDKGVKLVSIDYSNKQPGTDTISVTLKERIVNQDTGNEYWHVIKSQRFNVTIQQAENTAKSVAVTDISLPQATVEDEGNYGNYTDQKCTDLSSTNYDGCIVEAGNPFIINLRACKENPYNSTTPNCTKVTTQNSDVYVYLVGMGKTYKSESGNYATSSDVYELNGTFQNGVASIRVPEGTVTKAGVYKIYISTDGKKNDITGENKAIERSNYYVKISPRKAAKVKVEVNAITADQTGKAWCWWNSTNGNGNQSSTVVAKLLDQYGNIADNSTFERDTDKVTIKLKYNNYNIASFQFSKNSNMTDSENLNCQAASSSFRSINSNDREEHSLTVNLDRNDLNLEQVNESLPVNVYANYLVLNGTAFNDINKFMPTASGLMSNSTINHIILTAGNQTAGGINGIQIITTLGGTTGKQRLKFTFFGTNEQNVQVNNTANGTIGSGDLEINNLAAAYDVLKKKASNNSTCVWLEDDTGQKYLPKTCTQVNATAFLGAAKPRDIKIYQIKSYRYFPNGTSQVDWHEVTGDITLSGNPDDGIKLTLKDFNATIGGGDNGTKLYLVKSLQDNNATVNSTEKFPEYTARVVDQSGNFANATMEVSCTHTDDTVSIGNGIIQWKDPTLSEATCTFKSKDYDLSKRVTIHFDWSAGPDHVKIDVPSDYVLTNSKAPLVLSLRKADDTPYDDTVNGNYTLYISDPSLVRIYTNSSMDDSYEITNGDSKIKWDSNGEDTIFVRSLASTGDVTITIKNSAGTVTGTKTLHIVEKASDIPVTVGSITTSPESLTLMQQEEGTITATVKDTEGNPISSTEVSVDSDNTDIATVSPATCTTDANGQCTFTVTAGTTQGTAHITLTAQGQSAVVDVEVTEQQAQCDADHLNLCTTEEDCTGAGGYWYDDACHETQQQQPQPVPTEPTTQEITDVSTAPVNLGAVAAGTGDTMEMALNFPPYENPVDIYVGILLPTGDLYVLQSDNTLTPQLAPYAHNVTEAVSAQVFEPFSVCTPFGPAITEGTYYVFSLVVPTGTDLASMNAYDLRYYSFNVSCGD